MKAIILIGGLGTRLRPLTCGTPKPLLPVLNKPFILYQIELLKKYGINEIVFCLAYLSEEFKRFFGTGKKYGIKIHYAIEKSPLGTGGAIRNAAKFIDSSALIMNGDVFSYVNLKDLVNFHKRNNAKATITLVKVPDPCHYGLVETASDGRIKRFLEKPSVDEITCDTINAGVYLFEPEIFDKIPGDTVYSVERGLFPKLLEEKSRFYAYIYSDYWIDIGTTEKYLKVHRDLMERFALKTPDKIGKGVEVNGRVITGKNVKIGSFTRISGFVCLGDNVRVGKGCSLSDCVVRNGSRISDNCDVKTALIGQECVIENNVTINPGCAIGDGTVIRKYSKV